MSLDPRAFGDLRALLQGEPGQASFEQVVELALAAEAADREAFVGTWMPYIRAQLDRWYTQRPWAPRWELDGWGLQIWDGLWHSSTQSVRMVMERSALLGALRGLSLYAQEGRAYEDAAREALEQGELERLEWMSVTQTGEDRGLARALTQRAPRLRSLSWLERELTETCVGMLGEGGLFERLEGLYLSVKADALAQHALAERLRGCGALRHLDVGVAGLEQGVLERLLSGALGAGLESLGVNYEAFDVACLEGLAGLPADATPRLTSLMSAVCDMSDAHIAALLEWEGMARVRGLMLSISDLTGAGLRELALHPRAQALRELDVSASQIEDDAFEVEVVQALSRLEHLELWSTRLSAPGLAALGSGRWPHLKVLTLGYITCAGEDFEGLLRGLGNFTSLRALSLASTQLGDAQVETLLDVLPQTALRELTLSKCKITDVGAARMAASPAMRQMERLEWFEGAISEEGVAQLKASPYTKHLQIKR